MTKKEIFDEHVCLVDDRMSYFNVDDAPKCKLFALTLIWPTQLWFNGLPDGNINSGVEIHEIFSMQFIARKKQHLINDSLSGNM